MLAMQQHLFHKAMKQTRNATYTQKDIVCVYTYTHTHIYTHTINREWGCAHMHLVYNGHLMKISLLEFLFLILNGI